MLFIMLHRVFLHFEFGAWQFEGCFLDVNVTDHLYNLPPGWGVLTYKRLMGMCRWMGSHFHDWIDYNGVANFLIFGVREFFILPECFYCR